MSFTFILSCGETKKTDEKKVKNFVLIYTDELQFSDIEMFGGQFKTPNIDRLAAEGITFTNAYVTASMCTPSRFSVMTGQYPGRCRGAGFLKDNPPDDPYIIAWNTAITKDTPTIPKVLKKQGFVTGISGKWHIGDRTLDNGFPSFSADESYADEETRRKLKKILQIASEKIKEEGGFDAAETVLWGNFDSIKMKEMQFHNFGWITKGGVNFIRKYGTAGKPFFLYFATTAIHGPNHYQTMNADQRKTYGGYDDSILRYIPSKDSLKAMIKGLTQPKAHRCIGISNIDYQVGRLVKTLKEEGIYDETMIIFMPDHGIEPGKATAYEKGIKVPMIIRLPGGRRAGTHLKALVQNIDIFPTILDYAGIKIPQGITLDGKSFRELLEGTAEKVHDFIYAESGLSRAVTDGKYKYIAWRYPEETIIKMKKGKIDYAPNQFNLKRQFHSDIAIKYFPGYFDPDQLYDLSADPYEQNNIIKSNADAAKRYQKLLKSITETFNCTFDYKVDPFLYSRRYKKLVEKTKDYDLNNIEWYPRDHGNIIYPPKEK